MNHSHQEKNFWITPQGEQLFLDTTQESSFRVNPGWVSVSHTQSKGWTINYDDLTNETKATLASFFRDQYENKKGYEPVKIIQQNNITMISVQVLVQLWG